ncbi:MAG: hypothetical protein DRH37_09730 [Deltaproteobacteria bacterium]|nr:MAG: hypothetical protein DRH37_09730 [Deltaproteobacteria bacterium]
MIIGTGCCRAGTCSPPYSADVHRLESLCSKNTCKKSTKAVNPPTLNRREDSAPVEETGRFPLVSGYKKK